MIRRTARRIAAAVAAAWRDSPPGMFARPVDATGCPGGAACRCPR